MPICFNPRLRAFSETSDGRARQPTLLFLEREVVGPAEAALDGPPRPSGEDLVHLGGLHGVPAVGTHSGGDLPVESFDQLRETGADLVDRERGPQESHAAVDVVPDPPRRDDPLGEVERRHSADREPVAEVDVRHRQRVALDARKGRHVRELPERRVAAHGGQERIVREQDPRNPHPRLLRGIDPVGEFVQSDEGGNLVHGARPTRDGIRGWLRGGRFVGEAPVGPDTDK